MSDQILPLGHPGIEPRWTSSAKSGVSTSSTTQSRIWFTLSHGIVNEVYYPRTDLANTRDMGFLITNDAGFFSEEKRHSHQEIEMMGAGVPCFQLTNTCLEGHYRIQKTVFTDPEQDVLLQKIKFEALKQTLDTYHLYTLLSPHIRNAGYGNSGWIADYKGTPMLFAEREDTYLALACTTSFSGASCGYVGYSDGWQDISKNGHMTEFYTSAQVGNIALTAEIDIDACAGEFVLALAFGGTAAEAGLRARTSLLKDIDMMQANFIKGWEDYQQSCLDLSQVNSHNVDIYRVSTSVLKTHEEKRFPGGIIASLSIPWGTSKGDDDLGGYHLVWPRDLVESAGGLLAAGDIEGARRTLIYLMSTQESDGHWNQNMWLDGSPYWSGIQMDETAFPILLADALHRADGLGGIEPWDMVFRAASYIVQNGPMTSQDRWEEDGGFSPFTLAVEIASLVVAADFAERQEEHQIATYLLETADYWNSQIERWTYVTDTDLTQEIGVDGYYVRIAPLDISDSSSPKDGYISIKNRDLTQTNAPMSHIISPDALALVRFGLRSADDPKIVNTVKAIDALLKTDTKTGVAWHRYNMDGYGEHEDGQPFDGTGIGRCWPLLAGERGHYELANGNIDTAKELLQTMGEQCSSGGLIPEQIWDAEDIPDLELFNGQPAGSAMPLVWAHAEFIKLLRSIHIGQVFDMPPQTIQRYLVDKPDVTFVTWRHNLKRHSIPRGFTLRIEVTKPAEILWTMDSWQTNHTTSTTDTSLGIHYVDIDHQLFENVEQVEFTFHWQDGQWEGTNYTLKIHHD